MTQADLAERTFNALNEFLVRGDGCPRHGSLGECALLAEGPISGTYYAECSWWPETPIAAAAIAEVVHQAGGIDVWVSQHLWSDLNDQTGLRDAGGCIPFTIQFTDPEFADMTRTAA